MENGRITLKEHLDKYGWLRSRMVAKSILIDEVEIYGFINCSKEMLDEYKLLGIVDKDPSRQIIQCNYMYQIIDWFDGITEDHHSETIKEYLKMQKEIGFWEDPLQPYNPNETTSPVD